VTALKEMTKGERLVAEILGEIPSKSELILTDKHPFLQGGSNIPERSGSLFHERWWLRNS
jgi:hypothetical protein